MRNTLILGLAALALMTTACARKTPAARGHPAGQRAARRGSAAASTRATSS